jgi:hypothetical protein
MSFITKNYYWPAQDLEAVAKAQTVVAGNDLSLNGTLAANLATANIGSIDFTNISRTVIISLSASSTATFIIYGLRNGQTVIETLSIVSANNGTTQNFFDTITGITAVSVNPILSVRVGTGLAGMTRPFILNSFITNSPVLTSVQTVVTGNINYSVVGSIEKWSNTVMNNSFFINPRLIFLNQAETNSKQSEYFTENGSIKNSFITIDSLPLTLLAVKISSIGNGTASVIITSPRLNQ